LSARNKSRMLVVEIGVRQIHWLTTLVLLLTAEPVLACSCTPEAFAPACQKITRTEVVFRGSVRRIEPDPLTPKFPNSHVVRFLVETVYKGLPPGTTEVIVNPENFTTCEAGYRNGARYLIFGHKLPGTDQVLSGTCDGSRLVKYAGDDLRFLESFRKNQAGNAVYGRVLQWVEAFGRPRREEDAPVPGATVTLMKDGRRFALDTSREGAFRFEGIPPGAYTLFARREPYVPDPLLLKIDVPARGCVEVFPRLEAHAAINGLLTRVNGQPAARTRVELLRKNNDGRWYWTSQFWKNTNDEGQFAFSDIPSGDYLLGHEIWNGYPSNRTEYPTYYYPGVPDQKRALVLHVEPLQKIADVKLVLPKPNTPRRIRVVVVWPDGNSPASNLLQLSNGDELIENVGGALRGQPGPYHGGVVEFTGWAERVYELQVRYWIDDLGGPVPHGRRRIALSNRVKLMPGTGPATVKLVLTRTLLADEER
jgi:hypothetical protein